MTLPVVVLSTIVAAAASAHLPVSTQNSQAQAAIDRGLFLYYAYNGQAAARAFTTAAARDPHLAMAYWGLALADGPDLNTPLDATRFADAQQAIRRASLLSSGASSREQTLISIMARRYSGRFADWSKDDTAYGQAMAGFAQSSHDQNAALLAAEALLEENGLTWDGDRLARDGSRTAQSLVEDVLARDPTNPMANHLCVHLYDLASDRKPALPCAQRLDAAAFTAQAEHLAHMPAHYWIETGDYAAALTSSERAYALLTQLENDPDDAAHVQQYAEHDVFVGYSAAMMLGTYTVAQLWAQRMAGAYDIGFSALTALRFGRYADAYAARSSQFGNPAVRGLAALQLGRLSDARAIAAKLVGTHATKGYLPPLFLARMAEADGNTSAAQRWVAQAADQQKSDFSGELIPLLPAGEALGFFDLRRDAASDAVAAFTQTLATYPNDPRALYGLAAALTAAGQNAAAARPRSRFSAEWKGADTPLRGANFP